MKKYYVEIYRITSLDRVEVEAENVEKAKEMAYLMFHKYDRDSYDFMEVFCGECELGLETVIFSTETDNCNCNEGDE